MTQTVFDQNFNFRNAALNATSEGERKSLLVAANLEETLLRGGAIAGFEEVLYIQTGILFALARFGGEEFAKGILFKTLTEFTAYYELRKKIRANKN